jgi:hypothetical protein
MLKVRERLVELFRTVINPMMKEFHPKAKVGMIG